MAKKTSIEKGQVVIGYNSYGEVCGGRVTSVNDDEVAVSGMSAGSIHSKDCGVIEVPESPSLDSRLKPHVVSARKRAKAVADQIAKSKA